MKWEYPIWEHGRVKLAIIFYDFWIGAFYDQKKRTLYICPLPCVVVQISPRVTP